MWTNTRLEGSLSTSALLDNSLLILVPSDYIVSGDRCGLNDGTQMYNEICIELIQLSNLKHAELNLIQST